MSAEDASKPALRDGPRPVPTGEVGQLLREWGDASFGAIRDAVAIVRLRAARQGLKGTVASTPKHTRPKGKALGQRREFWGDDDEPFEG